MPTQPALRLKAVSQTDFAVLDAEGKPAGMARFEDLDEDGYPTYFILGRVSRRVS